MIQRLKPGGMTDLCETHEWQPGAVPALAAQLRADLGWDGYEYCPACHAFRERPDPDPEDVMAPGPLCEFRRQRGSAVYVGWGTESGRPVVVLLAGLRAGFALR